MHLLNMIYIDGKGFTELIDDMDKRMILEAARVLQDYEDEIIQYAEGKVLISKFGSIEITGFPKEVAKLIRNVLLE
jgi:hypothetical protein